MSFLNSQLQPSVYFNVYIHFIQTLFEIDYPFTYLMVAIRAQFAGMLTNSGPNLVDPRGRLLPRSYDILGDAFIAFSLYTLYFGTFRV